MTDPTAPPPLAGRREWIGLGVLALGTVMFVMDLTVLNLAVPSLSAELHPTSAQLLWIIDIYGFVVAGLLVTMGTLGDRFGRRKLLLIGSALFGAFSILAALSSSSEMLIGTRALLGLAGATLAPSTLSLIFFMFTDPRQRTIAIGVWVASFSAGSAAGPILGGIMLEFFWWGSVFLLALPVVAVLLVLGPRLLPEFRDAEAGRLDLLSALMSIVAVLAVILGLKQLAQDGLDAGALGAVIGGLVIGVLWLRRQRHLDHPMIDVSLFSLRSFKVSLVVNFLGIFVFVGYSLFVAQYLQLVAGLSPFQAGIVTLPSAVAFIVGSQMAPRLLRFIRPAFLIGGGLSLASVGLILLAQVGPTEGVPLIVVASVTVSLGLAPVFGISTELIVGSAPAEQAGAASGISETAIELGGALGIAILGSIGIVIYRSGVGSELPSQVPIEAAIVARDTLGGAVGVAADLPQEVAEALVSVARSAFVDGMQATAIIAAGVAASLAVLTLLTLRTRESTGSIEVTGPAPDEPR